MITSIGRYFVGNPNIVAIVSTGTLAEVTADDYISSQADNIEALQNGEFQWQDNDVILMSYDGGEAWFLRDEANDTFVAMSVAGASHNIAFADQVTTVGGAATEEFTVTGALATDLAFVQVVDDGTNSVTVLEAVVTANTLTVTFSGNPAADTVINYQLIRAA